MMGICLMHLNAHLFGDTKVPKHLTLWLEEEEEARAETGATLPAFWTMLLEQTP
jgi:hypothetical protein